MSRLAAEPEYNTPPTIADMRYGPHQRHVLDYWAPTADKPAPLIIYVHGGGFRLGDKAQVRMSLIELTREAGYALATINYRFSDHATAPDFMLDGARALQFLRAHADELGFDPKHVAMCGSSAGAGISLWVGFHDDLADPTSDDPVARQSTALDCMVIRQGQCSYDPRLFLELGLDAAVQHPFIESFYDLPRDRLDTPEAHAAFDVSAPITYLKAGAPPVYAYYLGTMDPVPASPAPSDPEPDTAWRRSRQPGSASPETGGIS